MKRFWRYADFRDEIESKARGLFEFGGWQDKSAQNRLVDIIWNIEKVASVKLR